MKNRHPRHFTPGILLRGQNLWVSELISIGFVLVVSTILLTLSFKIILNEYHSHQTRILIVSKRNDVVLLAEFKEQLTQKLVLARLLCSITGQKLPAHVIFDLSEIVYDNSTQFGYDPLLLLAVIKVESVFDTKALGRFRSGTESGAVGLMQLKFETACEVAHQLNMKNLTRNDLFRPDINIVLGTAYLTRMISAFKSFKLGILAYNQGPATVNRHITENTPLESRYYRKVLAAYYDLKKQAAKNETPHKQGVVCQ